MPDTAAGELLCGWGRAVVSRARVAIPVRGDDVADLFEQAGAGGVIARGLGRSYGDAAQSAGGTVVDLRLLDSVGELQPGGLVEVGAGASLDAVVRRTLPSGWFLPVTPGTRQVTVGGAIAADVHGKNHHADGSFARHVHAMTVATPTGTHRVSAEDDGPLFWATAGGMGLTGIVTSAVIRMLAVETDSMLVDTDRYADLDGVMAAMEEGDSRYRYSVAWIDCTNSGRAVLTRGEHALADGLASRPRVRQSARGGSSGSGPGSSGRAGRARLTPPHGPRLRAPRLVPPGLLNRTTIAAFNEAWYRRAPAHRVGELQSMWRFFHPLDGVADWNRLYGPAGFLQYQFAVPPERADVVRAAIDHLSRCRIPSFLAVLKRFGPGSPGPLSFPIPGWTLALDVPIGPEGLDRALDHLDGMVAGAGGRVYLAKDSRLRPDLVTTMYPRLAELETVRRRVDPRGVLRSDLSRRLGLS